MKAVIVLTTQDVVSLAILSLAGLYLTLKGAAFLDDWLKAKLQRMIQ
jgi:hypothetical protein